MERTVFFTFSRQLCRFFTFSRQLWYIRATQRPRGGHGTNGLLHLLAPAALPRLHLLAPALVVRPPRTRSPMRRPPRPASPHYCDGRSAPLQTCIAALFLFALVGWSAAAGLAVVLVAMGATQLVVRRVKGHQRALAARRDARVGRLGEALQVCDVTRCRRPSCAGFSFAFTPVQRGMMAWSQRPRGAALSPVEHSLRLGAAGRARRQVLCVGGAVRGGRARDARPRARPHPRQGRGTVI